MKKLFATIALFCCIGTVFSQPDIGWNMVNATKSILTLADTTFLYEQIPAGGSISWRDRFDKGDENPQDVVDIYNWLAKRNRFFSVVFCAGDEPELDNIGALWTLINAGIRIDAIEFVNEAFYPAGGYSFNWSQYEAALVPFLDQCEQNFPSIPVSIPLAPRPKSVWPFGANNHDAWNNGAFAFEDSHPQYNLAYSIHLYFTGDFVAALGGALSEEVAYGATSKGIYPTKRIYNYQTDFIDETYWQNIFLQADPLALWEPEINYIRGNTSAPLFVTEVGYVGTGSMNGSYVYAAKMFEILCRYGNDGRISSINLHAGISRSRAGACSPRKPWDLRDTDNANNVSTPTWDAVTLYMMMAAPPHEYTGQNSISAAGTYYYWFTNEGNGFTPAVSIGTGLQVDATEVWQVSANHWSSIACSMEFTAPGSVIGANEVTGITQSSVSAPISFGFVKVTVSNLPPPVEPCKKKWWQFWIKCPKSLTTSAKISRQ